MKKEFWLIKETYTYKEVANLISEGFNAGCDRDCEGILVRKL